MKKHKPKTVDLVCPSCGARLEVDMELGKILFHEPPPRAAKAPDLDHASQLLKKEAEHADTKQTHEQKRSRQTVERPLDQDTARPPQRN